MHFFIARLLPLLLTALLLALGMNIQRYSLTPSSLEDDGRIEVLGCCRMRKNALWLLGLAVYGSSNGPYMIGLSFAPLSLMTAVFASVLVFAGAGYHREAVPAVRSASHRSCVRAMRPPSQGHQKMRRLFAVAYAVL